MMMEKAVLVPLVGAKARSFARQHAGKTLEKRRRSQTVAAARHHWPLSLKATHANRSYLALP